MPPSYRPRRNPPPVPGEGVLMRHSSRPTNQCKGRSEPSTENSSDSSPHAAARSRPTTAPDASPSCARPSPTRRRRSRPGSRRGTGGAAVNSPTFRYPMPAADPRTGRGESAPRRTARPLALRPSPTTSPPTPASPRPTCGCWRPCSTTPGPMPAAVPATIARRPGPSPPGHRPAGLEPARGARIHPPGVHQGEPHRPPDPSDL